MLKSTHLTMDENEQSALSRRLVERSGLSAFEAEDMVEAYINAESEMVGVGKEEIQIAD